MTSFGECLSWRLEVAMKEDHYRIRKDQSPENFSILCYIALNLLKQWETAQSDIREKQHQAAWKIDFLFKLLNSNNSMQLPWGEGLPFIPPQV